MIMIFSLLLLNLNLALKMIGLWPKLRLQGTTASRLLEAQRFFFPDRVVDGKEVFTGFF